MHVRVWTSECEGVDRVIMRVWCGCANVRGECRFECVGVRV